MATVMVAPVVASRSSVIRCTRCGVSRPAGHVHCYVCGVRLGARGGRFKGWGGLANARGWLRERVGRAFRRRAPRAATSPRAPIATLTPLPFRTIQRRTGWDRAARLYAGVSVVGVAAWVAVGQQLAAPPVGAASAVSASEACVWLDAQRLHLIGEAGKVADAQRPVVAQRLAELAALVGSGALAR